MKDCVYGIVGFSIVVTGIIAALYLAASLCVIASDGVWFDTASETGVIADKYIAKRYKPVYTLEIELDNGSNWFGDVPQEIYLEARELDRVVLSWDYGKISHRRRNFRVELVKEKGGGK